MAEMVLVLLRQGSSARAVLVTPETAEDLWRLGKLVSKPRQTTGGST